MSLRHVLRRLANAGLSGSGLSCSNYPKPDYQPPTQRFSVASPKTSLAPGKLPTRRISLPLSRHEDYNYCRVRAGFPYICNDCVPACRVGLGGHSTAGTVLYCRSTVTGCSGCQGDLVMCFPPSTVAPGRATREVFTVVWGALTSRRT